MSGGLLGECIDLLLEQRRARMDMPQTVQAIHEMSETWHQGTRFCGSASAQTTTGDADR